MPLMWSVRWGYVTILRPKHTTHTHNQFNARAAAGVVKGATQLAL